MNQWVKNLPAMQETQAQSLGQEDPLEEEIATHSSILARRILWTEEPGGLQSKGQQSDTTKDRSKKEKKKERERAEENAQGSQNPAGSKPKPKVGIVGGGEELESKSGRLYGGGNS